MLNVDYTRHLFAIAGRLRLNLTGTIRLVSSYYLSRLPGHPRPRVIQIRAAVGEQKLFLHLRTNGTDVNVLSDIFYKCLYRVPETGIQTVLDLGGNIGLATAYLSTCFPNASFAVVEPSPANVAVLKKTVTANRLNVLIFQAAIGEKEGITHLHLSDDPSANSLDPASPGPNVIEVQQLTVESIRKTMGWTRIDLLKIDIEGYEKTLFRENAEWLKDVGAIIGEIHSHAAYSMEDLRRDLEPYGFSVAEMPGGDKKFGLTIFHAARKSN